MRVPSKSKIILLSHLGRIKEESDLKKGLKSLKKVATGVAVDSVSKIKKITKR